MPSFEILADIFTHRLYLTSLNARQILSRLVKISAFIVYWLKYRTNSLIWLAKRQPVHRRTDRRMDRATHLHNKQRSNSVKFHGILFQYLCRHTIKLLLTEISVHMVNIFVVTFKANGPHCIRYIRLECQNKNFLVSNSNSVNKSMSILFPKKAPSNI